MRRWPGIALILIVATLAVLAQPVAATGHLAVASAHTTDTDFNAATTLDNVSVVGSGPDASVVLDGTDGGVTVIDSFEWSTPLSNYTGSTGSFTTPDDPPNATDGDHYLDQGSDAFDAIVSTTGLPEYPQPDDVTSVDVYPSSDPGTAGDSAEFLFNAQNTSNAHFIEANANNDELRLRERRNGGFTTIETEPVTIDTDQYYTLEVDWQTPTDVDIELVHPNGTTIATIDTTITPITNGGTESTGIGFRGSSEAQYDFATLGTRGPPPTHGTYISSPHAAENVTEAWTNLTLENASADVTWQANTSGTWSDIQSDIYTTTGNKTVDVTGTTASEWRVNVTFTNDTGTTSAELHDEGLLFNPTAPDVDNASAAPSGGATVENRQADLSINITDRDFGLAQNDTLTAEFFLNGTSVGTDTLQANGTATASSSVSFGEHTWNVTVNDSYEESATSQTFTFEAPGNMTIYNETAPETIIDDQEVTGTFYELDGDRIFEKTTSDGNLSLEGIGTETFVVQLETSEYADRQVIIKDVTVQQDVWLLNASNPGIETVTPTFFVDDATGDFDETESRVYILRGLNISGETEYRTIAAEEIGTDGYTETLEMDVRYRLIVENQEGDRRVLGKFGASDSNSYTLTVEELEFSLTAADDAVEWGFNYTTAADDPQLGQDQVVFQYDDPDEETTDLEVTIYERGNQSNVLHDSTNPGPFGTLSITESIPNGENDSEWVVEWDAERDGTPINGSYTVGPLGAIGIPLEDSLKHVIAIGLILLIGGLASQVNAPTVGVATAGTAGIAYYIQWLPGEVAGGMIVLAFAVPVFYIVNRGGGV